MNIKIEISTPSLTLISSGSFITPCDDPIKMSIIIGGEQTVSVELTFCPGQHPTGRSMDRWMSEDGTIDRWNIYESTNGDSGVTISPVHVMSYEDEGMIKSLSLQLQTKALPSGAVKVEYAWWASNDIPDVRQ